MTLSDRWQELERKLGQIAATEKEKQDHLRMATEAESKNATAKAEAAQEFDAIMAASKARYQELALPAPPSAPASPPAPPPPPAADPAPAADPVIDTTDAAAAAETVLTPPAATLDEGAPAATTDEAQADATSAAA